MSLRRMRRFPLGIPLLPRKFDLIGREGEDN